MKRCITCDFWLLSSEPFEGLGYCIQPCVVAEHDITRTSPGYSCDDYELHEVGKSTLQLALAQDYLLALIGRERAEFGTIAWEAFCEDISKLYKRFTPQMQINVHDAFRLFMKRPNHWREE